MNHYLITYLDGTTQKEVGSDVQDVKDFLKRSYAHMGEPVSVVQTSPVWNEE